MKATTERRGGWTTWLLGLLDGALLGLPGLVFGLPGVAAVVLIIVASAALFRSLALLSGMLVGAGGLWAVLITRQMLLICAEPDRVAGEPCVSAGLLTFGLAAAGMVLAGAAIGAVAMRRQTSPS
jgi:hypothetical protein